MSDLSAAEPRPWILHPLPAREVWLKREHWAIGRRGGKGVALAFGEDDANAALIVKAVNLHDELVAALRGLVEEIETDGGVDTSEWPLLDEARAVLAKVSA